MATYLDVHGTLRPLGAIAFDMDGTLTRPYLDFGALRRRLDLPTGDILAWLEGLPPKARACADAILADFERDGVHHAEWNDGAEETLRAIQARDLPVALLTRNSPISVEGVCAKLGLCVDLAITRVDAPPKPEPECLRQVARHFGVPIETVVIVGDYRHDTEAGRAAGTLTVLLTNGRTPSWEVDADLVIERMPELAEYLVERRK